MIFSDEFFSSLRDAVKARMSEKRYAHTLGVERAAVYIAKKCLPERVGELRAAALLHDITKELDPDAQESLCRQYGIAVGDEERASPKLYHARTAAEKIRADFSELADPTVVSAVRWHTTGRADMTLPEKLLYLADYIDESRTFRNCVILRRYFFGASPEKMSAEERDALLRETLILSFDMTVRDLLEEGRSVAVDTVQARNALILSRTDR